MAVAIFLIFRGVMSKKSSRQLWTQALDGTHKSTRTSQTKLIDAYQRNKFNGIVLGVDPSLRGTGLAIVDFRQHTPLLLTSCRITCKPKLSFFECIHEIFSKISIMLNSIEPEEAAIEQTIYVQNYKISHTLGAARGASIAAIMQKGINISEYAPLRIKQAVTGVGMASKEQVRRTVCSLLGIKHDISYDESDAIAVACCHAWTYPG